MTSERRPINEFDEPASVPLWYHWQRLLAWYGGGETPSVDSVRDALSDVSQFVTVADNAVRTSGIAFGLDDTGGCVFGNVSGATINVEIGGFVRDGGCLAIYGH